MDKLYLKARGWFILWIVAMVLVLLVIDGCASPPDKDYNELYPASGAAGCLDLDFIPVPCHILIPED